MKILNSGDLLGVAHDSNSITSNIWFYFQAFLAAANSKKLLLFNVKTGKHLGAIGIPSHMERSMGKDDSNCMYEPTGLNLFIFDEDKLIAVHDYERSFPAVLDIYHFWW